MSEAHAPSDTSVSSALGWVAEIEQVTIGNTYFRTVLFTGDHLQLTVQSLAPGERIGWERHNGIDQFLRVERGTGRLELGRTSSGPDEEHRVSADWAMIIPSGTWHDVVNTGADELKLYSLYAPPHHPPGTIHRTKADSEAAEREEHAQGA